MSTELGKIFSRPDPLLTWKWEVDDVPFGRDYGIGPEYVETFEIPFNNIKSEAVFCAGGYRYFPGFHDVSAFNVTFYGDSKGLALKYLMGWKSKVKDFDSGIYALPDAYKRDWQVNLMNTQGDIVLVVLLQGCWPADTGQVSLNYDDGTGRLSFNQNFSVDNCKMLSK